jgi:hypothetical protein
MSALDRAFFRKVNLRKKAMEITETHAVIPALERAPEIRVELPNRRLLTNDERKEILAGRMAQIQVLDEEIEVERKKLLDAVKSYKLLNSGAAEVVGFNESVRRLMERRSTLARPDTWIEDVYGLNYTDIFLRDKDVRKLGFPVYQLKRRVEPISSIYVDQQNVDGTTTIDTSAIASSASGVAPSTNATDVTPSAVTTGPKQTVATGSIIGRRVLKLKSKPQV